MPGPPKHFGLQHVSNRDRYGMTRIHAFPEQARWRAAYFDPHQIMSPAIGETAQQNRPTLATEAAQGVRHSKGIG